MSQPTCGGQGRRNGAAPLMNQRWRIGQRGCPARDSAGAAAACGSAICFRSNFQEHYLVCCFSSRRAMQHAHSCGVPGWAAGCARGRNARAGGAHAAASNKLVGMRAQLDCRLTLTIPLKHTLDAGWAPGLGKTCSAPLRRLCRRARLGSGDQGHAMCDHLPMGLHRAASSALPRPLNAVLRACAPWHLRCQG